MPLHEGSRLGPYEIVAPLGAGGMGEVYRARDTRLKREVALKVLSEVFAGNAERMARFQREAEVLASLNHSNIAHIYGVEDHAIVMELVEGESPQGPMPFEDAWAIAMQIADALEYAHEKGIIHRDLKPANVKVAPDGPSGCRVKLLDFGLAKAFTPDPGEARGEASLTDSPTLTVSGTVAGLILGTAAYMAPEQAKGRGLDKRADIWSWGVMLYELLTGERLFGAEDVADTLAEVLTKEPNLQRVPAKVRRLLAECLQKDPKLRLRDIGDARRLLEEPAPDRPSAPLGSRLVWPVLAAVFVVISVLLGLVTWTHLREESPLVAKLFFPLPDETYRVGRPSSTAVSPDGRRVAVAGIVDRKGELWVRDLDNPAPRILVADGVDGMPFWAPDSRRLGFFADGKLKKVDVTGGGPAVTIADAQGTTGGIGPWTGSWNEHDVIVFGRVTSRLFRVSAAGGSPEKLTELDGTRHETAHFAPWFLPDGHHFLYVAVSTDSQKGGVFVTDLAGGSRKPLPIEATRTIYVAPGYLLFVRDGALMAQPFDTAKLDTTGEAVPVAEQADSRYMGVGLMMGYFSASQTGVLVYTSGRESAGVQLAWFDRTGKKLETVSAPAELGPFSLSPDETRVAFTRLDLQAGRSFLWTRDLTRGAETRMTTSRIPPLVGRPVWSADGSHLFYGISDANASQSDKIVEKAANNTGAEAVVELGTNQPMDASRDGRYLFMVTSFPQTNHVWILPLFGDRHAFPYVSTEFQETEPRVSPDGRWLAYQSNESKRTEIYVVSFPQPTEKWAVSTDGGQTPVWSSDQRELFYRGLDGKITAVNIKAGSRFQFGVPKALFDAPPIRNSLISFDVSKDGRFLLPALVEPRVAAPMTVVLNWPALLRRGR
jgi:serine/threonine protein kinase/Tol biopolymer transport system component